MNLQDAIRKVRLLENVRAGRGFTQAEIDAARELSQRLRTQFSIREGLGPTSSPIRLKRMPSWDHWEQVATEFGLRLHRFGKRASIAIIEGKHVISIKGEAEEWTAQKSSVGGWESVGAGSGPRSLHTYLAEHAVRNYSFLRSR